MLVSIITVNYNNAVGLEATIKSVVDQTWQDFEFIIIDGGSTDESKKLIAKYADKIAYWCSEKDDGIYHAMNKGIKAAKGEYLYFLNSGDLIYAPSTLKSVSEKLNTTDIVYGNLLIVEPDKQWVKFYNEKLSFEYFVRDTLPHQGSFIKRALFTQIEFYDEGLKIVADWKFFLLAVIRFKVSVIYINEVICRYDRTGISANPTYFQLQDSEKQVVLTNEFSSYYEGVIELHELRLRKEFIESIERDFFIQKYLSVKMKWKHLKKKLRIDKK